MKIRLTGRGRLLAVAVALVTIGISLGITAPAGAAVGAPQRAGAPASASGANITDWNGPKIGTLCLGIAGGLPRSPAVQWSCENHADQLWATGSEYGSTGYYQFVNNDHQCLGVAGGSTQEGARVYAWNCIPGARDQYWKWGQNFCEKVLPLSGVTFDYNPLYNLKSGDVLGVSGNSSQVGAPVVIWRFQGVCNNQFWEFE
jgi:hypothetical protein